jgi:hypothetical protein
LVLRDLEPERRLFFAMAGRSGSVVQYMLDVEERQRTHALEVFGLEVFRVAGDRSAEFVERVLDGDARIRLTFAAIEAAARSAFDLKIRAIGRALVSGVLTSDDAEIDEANLVIGALRDLEMVELGALQVLMDTQRRGGGLFDPKNALAEQSYGSEAVQDALVAKLTRHGLINTFQKGELAFGGTSGVSVFGSRVFSYVEERGGGSTAAALEEEAPS